MAATQDDRIGGYLASALAFAGITALWAWIVRDDPYYAMTELLGLTLPAATVFYLTAMPIIGFFAGRWRFQATGARGAGAWAAKAIARALQFFYAHILIALFTIAMVVDHFLGWNIDDAVEAIDNGLFDIAARFSPWLSAYLAGFNLGRVTTISRRAGRHGSSGGGHSAGFARAGADGAASGEPAEVERSFADEFIGDRHDRVMIEGPAAAWPDRAGRRNRTDHPSPAPPRFSRLR